MTFTQYQYDIQMYGLKFTYCGTNKGTSYNLSITQFKLLFPAVR